MQTTSRSAAGPGGRPVTGASSVSLSSIGSMSMASDASATPSQLNALIQRRTALRSQMAVVEQQLAQVPPSTAASSVSWVSQRQFSQQQQQQRGYSSGGRSVGGGTKSFAPPPAIEAAKGARPMALLPIPPRDPAAAAAAKGGAADPPQLQPRTSPPPPPPVIVRSGGGEESLPGAMRPGRYAFWPKRLPGAASRRSFATGRLASGATASGTGPAGVVAGIPIGAGAAMDAATTGSGFAANHLHRSAASGGGVGGMMASR